MQKPKETTEWMPSVGQYILHETDKEHDISFTRSDKNECGTWRGALRDSSSSSSSRSDRDRRWHMSCMLAPTLRRSTLEWHLGRGNRSRGRNRLSSMLGCRRRWRSEELCSEQGTCMLLNKPEKTSIGKNSLVDTWKLQVSKDFDLHASMRRRHSECLSIPRRNLSISLCLSLSLSLSVSLCLSLCLQLFFFTLPGRLFVCVVCVLGDFVFLYPSFSSKFPSRWVL